MITLDHAYHGHVISQIDISPYKFNKPGGAGCPPTTFIAPVPDVYRGKHRDVDYPGQDMGEVYARQEYFIKNNMGTCLQIKYYDCFALIIKQQGSRCRF